MSDLFGIESKSRHREIHIVTLISDQSLGCAYCGWPIRAGEPFRLVVLDDDVRFYCQDDEQCAKRAGK